MFPKKYIANVIYKFEADSPYYHSFTEFKGNRPIEPFNVERIRKSMKEIGFLDSLPMIVDKHNRVVDGKNRYAAAKSIGEPIYVTESNTDNLGQLAIALNTNKKNWSLLNFANYWAQQEDDPEISRVYRQFLSYKENNNITCGVLIAIFEGETSRAVFMKNGGNRKFKEGKLDLSRRNHIEDTLSKLRQLKEASLYDPISKATLRKQQFQEAMLQVFEVDCFNFDVFLGKLCRAKHSFNKLAKRIHFHEEIMRIFTEKEKKC